MTGAELLGGPRGTDLRLDGPQRPTRGDKRREYTERMDAKTEARARAVDRARGRPLDGPGRRLTATPRSTSAGCVPERDDRASRAPLRRGRA